MLCCAVLPLILLCTAQRSSFGANERGCGRTGVGRSAGAVLCCAAALPAVHAAATPRVRRSARDWTARDCPRLDCRPATAGAMAARPLLLRVHLCGAGRQHPGHCAGHHDSVSALLPHSTLQLGLGGSWAGAQGPRCCCDGCITQHRRLVGRCRSRGTGWTAIKCLNSGCCITPMSCASRAISLSCPETGYACPPACSPNHACPTAYPHLPAALCAT